MPNWKKVIVSGSNAFLHHVTASGNISASGTIYGSAYYINDKYLIRETSGIATIGVGGGGITNILFNSPITASGNISSSGTGSFSDGRFTGKVGIGTTTPSTNLEVSGSVTISGSAGAGSTTTLLNVGGLANGRMLVRHIEGKSATSAATCALFLNYDNSGLTSICAGGGNVGIGTTVTPEKLTVAGDISASGDIHTDGGLNFNAADNSIRTFNAGADGGNIRINPDGNLYLGHDRTDATLIGRSNNTGYTTKIYGGTSTENIKLGSTYTEINQHITASGNISSSGNITALSSNIVTIDGGTW